MTNQYTGSVAARLPFEVRQSLRDRARQHGMRTSEYLRTLILADEANALFSRLIPTIEGEHMRLILIAAQKGQPLTFDSMMSLREQAIINAPALVEHALHRLKQIKPRAYAHEADQGSR